MSILIKLYVLSTNSSDILDLTIDYRDKKKFEPTKFELPNIQNITNHY